MNSDRNKLFSLFGEKSPIRMLKEDEPDFGKCISFFYSERDIVIDCLEKLYFVWDLSGCKDKFDEKEKVLLQEMNLRLDLPSAYYITEENDENILLKLINTENDGWIVDRLLPLLLSDK